MARWQEHKPLAGAGRKQRRDVVAATTREAIDRSVIALKSRMEKARITTPKRVLRKILEGWTITFKKQCKCKGLSTGPRFLNTGFHSMVCDQCATPWHEEMRPNNTGSQRQGLPVPHTKNAKRRRG